MSSTKKWLAALLAAVLVFGNVVYALNRPLHAEETAEAPVEEAAPAPAAEPEVQSEPEIVIEVVEQTPVEEPVPAEPAPVEQAQAEQPQEPAPATEPETKPVEAKAPETTAPETTKAPEATTAPAESAKPEATTAPAESAKPEETKAPEASARPVETAKYSFYGTDGEIVLEKEYKLGETASAPADYRPGEVTWFVKGTENEFKDTVVNDCSPVEAEARENAAPAEADKAETPASDANEAEAGDVNKSETAATEDDKAREGDAENIEKTDEAEAEKKPEKAKKAPAKKAEPERTIVVSASWEGEELFIGDVMTLKATLKGFENTKYTLQWQYSADNTSWTDVAGATGDTLAVTMTEENCLYYWRVNAVIAEEETETEDAAEDAAKTEGAAAEEPVKTETPATEGTDAKSE